MLLKYFTVKEVIHQLGNEDLENLKALIPGLIKRNTDQGNKNLQKAVQEIIPGFYNSPERDWRVRWNGDKFKTPREAIIISWNWGPTMLRIAENSIVFEALTYQANEPYYQVKIIPDPDPNIVWTSTVEKKENVYCLVEKDYTNRKYLQKGINTFEEWLVFIIHAYVPLALRFQEIKDRYYAGVNNIHPE